MAKLGSVKFTGASGKEYVFDVHPWGAKIKRKPGVYFITRRIEKGDGVGAHARIYVGQTTDLSQRFDRHQKTVCFKRNRANSICVLFERNDDKRETIVADLLSQYITECND